MILTQMIYITLVGREGRECKVKAKIWRVGHSIGLWQSNSDFWWSYAAAGESGSQKFPFSKEDTLTISAARVNILIMKYTLAEYFQARDLVYSLWKHQRAGTHNGWPLKVNEACCWHGPSSLWRPRVKRTHRCWIANGKFRLWRPKSTVKLACLAKLATNCVHRMSESPIFVHYRSMVEATLLIDAA